MNHYLTSRLKAKASTRNAEIVVAADAAGEAADREIMRAIGMVVESASRYPSMVQAAIEQLPKIIRRVTIDRLTDLALWSHRQAATDTFRTLTPAYRSFLARRRNLRESVLLEEDPTGFRFWFDPEFGESADLSDYLNLIFPPPAKVDVRKTLSFLIPEVPIGGGKQGVRGPSAADALAEIISKATSEGKNNREVAKAILPFFAGNRAGAIRSARTYGMFIANEMHREISDGMGEIVAGRQVHNPGGENARPDHALRSGTIYYKRPTSGQYGYDVMPRPPYDTGRGPYEDGSGIKWNCRCWMTDVLTPLESIANNKVIQNARSILVPDVLTQEDWWDKATEKQRRAFVGTRRYDVLTKQSDNPSWSDFISPTGQILGLDSLRNETAQQRADRKKAVKDILRYNAKQRADVLQFGFAV
jgi:hypothetical protein